MSPIVAAVLRSVVLPSVLATICLFLSGRVKEPSRAWIQALILGVAYCFGSYMLIDRLGFPPTDPNETLSYIALILASFVFIAPRDLSRRYGVRALFVLLCGGILLWHIRATLGGQVHLRNMVAFFCLCLGLWSIVERNGRHMGLPALLILPIVSAIGASMLLMVGGSAALSQLVGIICGLLGGAFVIALFQPQRLSVMALLPFLSVFITFFMVAGHFYLDINPWHMVYVCWPFALLWARPWLPIPKNVWAEAAILTILAAVPVGYFLIQVFKTAGPLY